MPFLLLEAPSCSSLVGSAGGGHATEGWVPPSAGFGAASDTEDAVPVGPGVATAVVSMGKGKAKSKAATGRRGQGYTAKAVSFAEKDV